MNKKIIIVLSVITLVVTFIFAEIFSIYDFGTLPTLLTTLYLISIFSIIEYLLISITYVIRKMIKKEKIKLKKIIGLILLFIALLFVLLFLVCLNIDYLHMYMYSSPLYLIVIGNCIEFLLPAVVFAVIGIILLIKKK